MELPTKADLIKSFSGAKETDPLLGEVVLSDLPEVFFHRVVEQHNRNLEKVIETIPERRFNLKYEIEKLKIPTFEAFQGDLADKDRKAAIDAHLRKAKFDNYKRWLREKYSFLWDNFLSLKFPFRISQEARQRHSYIVGKSGFGKSELLKILCVLGKQTESGIDKSRSLILIDPAGDLADQVARQTLFYDDFQKNKSDPNLIYIDPFLADGKNEIFPTINPLDISGLDLDEYGISALAENVCSVFQALLRNDAGLSLQMETLLIPCLTVLIERPGSTLFDLLRFMNDETNEDLYQLGLNSNNAAHRLFFRDLFRTNRFNPTKSSIATKTQSLLNNKIFANVIAREQSTINLEKAINSGKSIVLNCAKGQLGEQTAEALGRFIVAQVLSIALNRAQRGKARIPIDLIIDEAQNFVSENIKTILTETRKYGLHLTFTQQVAGQDMTVKFTQIILGNTAVQIVGNAGKHSREVFSREMAISSAYFDDLEIGEFVIKTGKNQSIVVKVRSDYIKYRKAVSLDKWQALKTAILDKYYTGNIPEAPEHKAPEKEEVKEKIKGFEERLSEPPEEKEKGQTAPLHLVKNKKQEPKEKPKYESSDHFFEDL